MAHDTRFWSVSRATAVIGTLVLASLSIASIDETQVECEEAVAHVLDCCPGLLPQDVCGAGCSEVAISIEESRCLRDHSCEELQANGTCDRFSELMVPDAGSLEVQLCE